MTLSLGRLKMMLADSRHPEVRALRRTAPLGEPRRATAFYERFSHSSTPLPAAAPVANDACNR